MIVLRQEFEVKLGRSGEAIELVKWLSEQLGELASDRVYYNRFGEGHRIAFESEFENLAGYEKWHAEQSAALAKVMDESRWKAHI